MKNVLVLSLLTMGILFSKDIYSQAYQNWKYTHPTPQANLLRNIQMINEDNWVAIGGNGTFMRTTDGGISWFFHNQAGRYLDDAKTIGNVFNLWFFDANNGYVIGERGYIGKTTDGGNSFDSVGVGVIPVNEWGQGIWFANPDTGFVSTRTGSWTTGRIVRTTDGGVTWTTVQTYSQGITAVWGTNSQTVYAVAVDGTIFKTTNCGQTWTQNIGVVGPYMYGMGFVDQNSGFVVGSQGGIYRTTNAGTTWLQLNSPQVDWAYFRIKIISSSEIYLVGDPSFLYKSTDLGDTWQPISIAVNGPASTYLWYGVDKINNIMTISGDLGVVAKSTDNGQNWLSNQYSLNTNIIFDLKKVPGTSNLIAVGREFTVGTRQVFYSTDFGNYWTTKDLGIDMNASSVCMVNSQIGYISGTNCRVFKTTDGGQTWFQVTQPLVGTYDLFNIDFVNPDTGWVFINYIGVNNGNIFKTTDSGNSWVQQTTGVSGYAVYSADMVNADLGYLTINSSGQPIYKTTDGGNNWLPITTPLNGIIKTIKAIDENLLYIGASSGTVRMAKSTNGGTDWIPISLPITLDISSMDFMDADTGYVCGNSVTAVCRTNNGGINWSFENVHLPTLLKVSVLSNDVAFALGTYASIMRYDPHGIVPVEILSFTSVVTGNNVELNWSTATETNNRGFEIERAYKSDKLKWDDIGFVRGNGTTTEPQSFSYTDRELSSGRYLYRLKQIDFDGSYVFFNEIEVDINAPVNFALTQNYPNPFNPSTRIQYTIPAKLFVSLKIYDILGREIVTLVNEEKERGTYSVDFKGNNLSSGIYIFKIQAGSFVQSRKMILMK